MAVPKRKVSKARRDSRSANKGLKVKSFSQCQSCSAPVRPHQACSTCGYYKGQKVLATKGERLVKRIELRRQAQSGQSETTTTEVSSTDAESAE